MLVLLPEAEKEKIGSKRIEKAYGTTLMAAVRTWIIGLLFHIGDGKVYACDDLMQMDGTPWDCNCFMNTTTSLCGDFPANDLDAFDGTGNFPIAFALGSDGIDDTFLHSNCSYYINFIIKFFVYSMSAIQKNEKDYLNLVQGIDKQDLK